MALWRHYGGSSLKRESPFRVAVQTNAALRSPVLRSPVKDLLGKPQLSRHVLRTVGQTPTQYRRDTDVIPIADLRWNQRFRRQLA